MDNFCKVREFEYSQYDIDPVRWADEKPTGISGMFRVRNDHEFLYRAVTSHLPFLDEAVIVIQPSDRETYKVLNELNHLVDVRFVEYPVAPVFITDPRWQDIPENSIDSFVFVSNWAINQCRYSWVAQIEADVIACSTFGRITDAIRSNPTEKALYGRYLLNVAGVDCDLVSVQNPRNGGWDEKIFPNHPDYHYCKKRAYEVLSSPYKNINMGWSGLHMKRCKKDKIGWNNETYVPFDPANVARVLRAFNENSIYMGPDNPEGEPCLFDASLLA